MLNKKQTANKYGIIDKRIFHAALAIVPTSILINQTLARLKFSEEKKIKFAGRIKDFKKFR